MSLDGAWDFSLDGGGTGALPSSVSFDREILVPFSPETLASGIEETGFIPTCWYRKTFEAPRRTRRERIILHFGAVDHHATVWVNDSIVAEHAGGYTPFRADITDVLTPSGPQTLAVRADDDPHDLAKPRGKQDWQLTPHSIWYPRTTGIWQTVWLERVSATFIDHIRWTPSLERWEIGFEARVLGAPRDDLELKLELRAGDIVLSRDTYAVIAGEVHRRIALSDPGIDDYRNELLWSPATPTIIDAKLELVGARGETIDTVHSYTALRSIGVQGDRFVLNGRPDLLRMVLDQGYWPETGLTAPDDASLRRDVELAKAMGFNGVRKHQKIEDPRYLYWADVLGLIVWEEMPSAYRYTQTSIERLTREWIEVLHRDMSHPSIVAWVPFNESWGVPNLPDSPAQRHYVQALYHLTKTIDPTRPVVGNDGWESAATDIVGIHDYDEDPGRIATRYGAEEHLSRLFQKERPGGRLLILEGHSHSGQPIMLTEFGGIAYYPDGEDGKGLWGYSRAESAGDFAERYASLAMVVRSLPLLAGFCYTQFTDTYQEVNGLLYADRSPKLPIEEIATATRGPRRGRDIGIERAWRERMMHAQRDQCLVPSQDYRIQEGR